jgi:hypothetical protein
MMLVLSATGAPASVVKRFDPDMAVLLGLARREAAKGD